MRSPLRKAQFTEERIDSFPLVQRCLCACIFWRSHLIEEEKEEVTANCLENEWSRDISNENVPSKIGFEMLLFSRSLISLRVGVLL